MFAFPLVSFGLFGKVMKELIESRNELQIVSAMIVFFDWHGMTGNDSRDYEFLVKHTFPITTLAKCFNNYEAYIRNVLKINFDHPETLKKFINKSLSTDIR